MCVVVRAVAYEVAGTGAFTAVGTGTAPAGHPPYLSFFLYASRLCVPSFSFT